MGTQECINKATCQLPPWRLRFFCISYNWRRHIMTQKTHFRAAVLAAATLLGVPALAFPVLAAEPASVATVNGEAITVDDYRVQQSRLPAEYFTGSEAARTHDLMLRELINDALLLDAAKKDGIAKTPEYAARIAEYRQYVLRELYLTTYLKTAITEDMLRKQYATEYEQGSKSREINARHILVKTKAEAEAIIVQLDKGAAFADLAKDKSTDISKIQGGDLGWFSYETMVPAFADAAFKLKKGEYTKTPVQSPFGFHVIKLEDSRAKKIPSFEEVRGQLEGDLNQKLIEARLAELRKTAKITLNKDLLAKLAQEKPADQGEDAHGGHDHGEGSGD
jgi:peptidyl-prolyl cis-trans isomerase C